jgi:cation diffusion facilitator family transporter
MTPACSRQACPKSGCRFRDLIMENNKSAAIKKKAVFISFCVGILMFVGKLGAYFLTNSAAILSDAIESIVHIIAVSFVFYSLILSLRPASKIYPYGYGKVEYFSAGFEGALIIIAAISIIYYAMRDIVYGSVIGRLNTGAIIIGAASVINIFLGIYLVRTGKKTNSLILIADGKHILTDSYTSIGVIAGILMVVFTGVEIIDPVVAIAVALNILFTGAKLVKQSIGGLMNKTEEEMINKIANVLTSYKSQKEDWIDIHLLRYWKSGDRYFVDFHITMPYYLSVQKSHDYNTELHQIFKDIFETDAVDMIMHLDPCKPWYCNICRKANCDVRQSEHTKDLTWDANKIVSRAPYLDVEEQM